MPYIFKDEEELKELLKQQCINVANELVSWTEDLSLPNQNQIHDLCNNAPSPDISKYKLADGKKICDCPECGAQIIAGISKEVQDSIKNSKLFTEQKHKP